MTTLLDASLIADTLQSLPGWQGDPTGLWREVHLTPEQDAELRRQVAVDADAMDHHPELSEVPGGTRIELRTHSAGGVTELDVIMASHISDLAHRLSADEPGVDAVRHGAPVAVMRSSDGSSETSFGAVDGDDPYIGAASASGTPLTPMPDTAPHEPEPGPSQEQIHP